jgi:DNA sulfur modification protein DndD
LKRAERADRIAKTINAIIDESVPRQIITVAEEMSHAYRAMAHKSVVQSVVIEPDCTVKLMSKAGRNVREMSLSAGEQQIFAQALISAISKVSQRVFPIVVDTPLGRLDDAHRSGVLKHFTAREGQVFLLSTDTEIVGRYFRLMEPRLAKAYHLAHEHDGHVGRTSPVEGYFEGIGA